MKGLGLVVATALGMALLSAIIRLVVRANAPDWEASPPPNAGEVLVFVVPLVVGGYVSARLIKRNPLLLAAVAGFASMTGVALQGARPWWLAAVAGTVFAIPAVIGALLARWPRRGGLGRRSSGSAQST